jgi:hypothetical protein
MSNRKTSLVLLLFGLVAAFTVSFSDQALGSQAPPQAICDPVISGIASFIFPGWGQYLNGETGRKPIIHLSVGLGLTLAIIYFWGTSEGNFARVGRILWSTISGFEAFGTCDRLVSPQQASHF